MKVRSTDPDLSTIYNRIKNEQIDLQPDFQRGEVWTSSKKKLLIDTILREWQVPPIHVILNDDDITQEVLDGQQRLCTIRDFMDDKIKINGNLKPYNNDLMEVHGSTFSRLPKKLKLKFERYAIRIFEIYEYEKGEPGELFNRLNQSLTLTGAEKRNAYVGGTRKQIKEFVNQLNDLNVGKEFLGFSDLRMAYHDLFARLGYLLELKDLTANPSDKDLEDLYREDRLFSDEVVTALQNAIYTIATIKDEVSNNSVNVHITKASIFSWLFFISMIYLEEGNTDTKNDIIKSFINFEVNRYNYKNNLSMMDSFSLKILPQEQLKNIYLLFNERASSRVMTSGSLLIREACLFISLLDTNSNLAYLLGKKENNIRQLINEINLMSDVNLAFEHYLFSLGEIENA
ncbi:TPA: DUF262 domain-containing protein [Salmonella enterica]|nr:DUF262 domain-containing protein [Salmonella enterica]